MSSGYSVARSVEREPWWRDKSGMGESEELDAKGTSTSTSRESRKYLG